MHQGSCICGKVKFQIEGELKPPHLCHCSLCRKGSGHVVAGVDVDRAKLTLVGEENVTWFESSEWARRGFCKNCGSNLFFDPIDKEAFSWTGISMGALEGKTNVKIKEHIFVNDKGDYYELSDGLPRHSHYPGHEDNKTL